jgi:SMI1-KNR4 cell-wall
VDLEELCRVLPPPGAPAHAEGDWSAVEAKLSTPLPGDYKGFIARYGSGKIADRLRIRSPFAPDDAWFSWVTRTLGAADALRALGFFPLPVFPAASGLLPWGSTDEGGILYWETGEAPDAWPVVVMAERGPEHDRFDGTMSAFLVALFTGRFKGAELPPDLADDPRFEVEA